MRADSRGAAINNAYFKGATDRSAESDIDLVCESVIPGMRGGLLKLSQSCDTFAGPRDEAGACMKGRASR